MTLDVVFCININRDRILSKFVQMGAPRHGVIMQQFNINMQQVIADVWSEVEEEIGVLGDEKKKVKPPSRDPG